MQTIDEYAAIEKLKLTDEENTWIKNCLDTLADSFNELSSVDTDNVEPLITVLDVKNVLRDDISMKMLPRDDLLSNAPEQYEGYYQVPRTI